MTVVPELIYIVEKNKSFSTIICVALSLAIQEAHQLQLHDHIMCHYFSGLSGSKGLQMFTGWEGGYRKPIKDRELGG